MRALFLMASMANAVATMACGASAPDAVALPRLDTAAVERRLTAPPGLRVTQFASGVSGVRFMALGPDGEVYASQPGLGRIVRLPDHDRDWRADSVVMVVDGLRQPHGLAFHKGMLWVASTDGVVRVALGPNRKASGAPQYVNHYSAGGGHFTRTIVFGADSAMYVSVGSSCNLCVESSPDRAAVLRFDEDGGGKRVYASGLRNAVGLAVHPLTGAIWATQNERDNLAPSHEDLPPEEIDILRDGGDYGWPYCYGDRVPNPEYHDAARCAATIPPAIALQAHSAPLGLAFLDRATALPLAWRGDLLVAYHGSWNRSVPTGAKVVRVRIASGRPVSVEDFVTGWQDASGARWGRPVDVLVAADGSVLVSDDGSGAIYRVAR